MANTPEPISYIQIGENIHPIDAISIDGKTLEDIGELVTSIDSNSTDNQYPSAKCIYEMIYGTGGSGESTQDTWEDEDIWDDLDW